MDAEGYNAANTANVRVMASGGTTIAAGLDMALMMMEGRRQRNPVSALLLLTDGQDGSTRHQVPALIARANAARCGVYAFGFGSDHDASLMSDIAEQARTPFTFVEDEGAIREAFAGVVGGLSSMVGQVLHVSLRAEVPLKAVHTPFETTRFSDTDVNVEISDIMAEERKDILVELSVPADPTASSVNLLMKASLQYNDLTKGAQVTTPVAVLETNRCDEPLLELEPDEEVTMQRERVEVTEALKQAALCSDQGRFNDAQEVISRSEAKVKGKRTKNCEAMELELQDARSRMQSRRLWEMGGRAEIRSSVATNSWQRCYMESTSEKSACIKKTKAMYTNSCQMDMIKKSRRL